jgi:penicillin-binding protein 1A
MTDISIKRKVREMYLAQKVEEMYTKDEILLMYLNTINYGSGAYGIEAAAQKYFSVSATELTLAQAATLVGIPQSPTYNNPIDHYDTCKARRDVVLSRMVSGGYITQEEADAAMAEELVLNVSEQSQTGILAYPYFTSYVRNQLLNQDGKYAFSTADLFAGGLQIVTTLDVDDQAAAEDAAATKEAQAGSDFEVAMVAIDPDNGHIKAMVGGKDYETDQINMATGEGSSGRQCGSSFKTFTLAAAIEAGIDPSTMIDAGYSITLDGAETVYNYGKYNYGTRSIESAFAVSSNTAFTRLIMSVGVDKVKDMAKRLGITSSLQSVAGLTLGISSVTPLEMSSAYATIANGGTYYSPECILKITDRNGNVIVDNSEPTGTRVISEEVAAATIKVMESVVNYGTGTDAKLSNGQAAAGKTGTTETEQDSWFCGITPQMSVAIWLGERADNYSDAKSVYVTATSVFSDFMNQILKGQKTEDFITAADPDYDETYFDAKYHIGTSGSWEYSEQDYAGGSSSYYSSSSSSSSSASSTYSTDSERSYGDALGSTYDDSDYSDSGPSGGLAQTMTSVSGTG